MPLRQVTVASGTVDFALGSDTGGALPFSAQYTVARFGVCVFPETLNLFTSARSTQFRSLH